ncbi:MAG: hypothetical protein IH934_06180 [Nanoarchaeota archaeon]|nr:hypothetical protein [Nanoarchaeota archaeon]
MVNKNHLKVYFLVFSLLVAVGVVVVTNVDNTVAVTHNPITGAATALNPISKSDRFIFNHLETRTITLEVDGAKKKEFIITANIEGIKAKFTVNDEETNLIGFGGLFTLKDGSVLIVNTIGGNQVQFTLTSSFTNVELFGENTIKSTLLNGEKGEFSIKGKNFDVTPIIKGSGSSLKVTFNVNNELMGLMIKGDSFTLKDGSIIIVSAFGQEQVRFTLELRAPDLIVESITISPTRPKTGELVTFTYTVKNVGNDDAAEFVLGTDYGDGTGAFTSSKTTLIAAGLTITQTLRYTYPKSQSYIVKISASNSRDLNKDNDELTKTIVVSTKLSIGITEPKFFSSSIDLVNGWNLISVTPGMVGWSILQMSNAESIPESNRCEIEQPVWIWFPNDWKLVKPSSGKYMKSPFDQAVDVVKFGVEQVYLGMWLNVKNPKGCRLGCGVNSCVSGVG